MGKISSGKGTQAHGVIEAFGGTLYSNGDKMRATATLPTPFGQKMKETYEGGYLMPEWVASYWMTHALATEFPNDTIVFEGVAKKPNEAQLFDEIHHWIHRPYVVFHLEISDEEVRRRSERRARDVVDAPKSVGGPNVRLNATRGVPYIHCQIDRVLPYQRNTYRYRW
jgi:adenylate kinase family enzyme